MRTVADLQTNPPYRTRDIEIKSAVAEVGYGYVMYASREDWADIAKAQGENATDYITSTVADYPPDDFGPKVGIHFDAAELAAVFDAIASLDL